MIPFQSPAALSPTVMHLTGLEEDAGRRDGRHGDPRRRAQRGGRVGERGVLAVRTGAGCAAPGHRVPGAPRDVRHQNLQVQLASGWTPHALLSSVTVDPRVLVDPRCIVLDSQDSSRKKLGFAMRGYTTWLSTMARCLLTVVLPQLQVAGLQLAAVRLQAAVREGGRHQAGGVTQHLRRDLRGVPGVPGAHQNRPPAAGQQAPLQGGKCCAAAVGLQHWMQPMDQLHLGSSRHLGVHVVDYILPNPLMAAPSRSATSSHTSRDRHQVWVW